MNNRLRVLLGTRVRVTLIVAAVLVPRGGTSAQTDSFTEVMRRAHQYAVIYQDHELSSVIAREHYQQLWLDFQLRAKAERALVSDYLLFQVPPDEAWLAYRDVYEMDGMPIRDRAARLKSLLGRPRDQRGDLASEIMLESGRFNLAPTLYQRTLNVPTLALRLLLPASRSRIVFKKVGEEPVESTNSWIVEYRETRGPTLVATPNGRDLPAHGRFWVEPETGAIMRSEMVVGGTRQERARVTIVVTYRREPALGFHVPIEMLERYETPSRAQEDVVIGRAIYSGFRRFDLRTLVP